MPDPAYAKATELEARAGNGALTIVGLNVILDWKDL